MSFDIPSGTPLGQIRRAPENFVSRGDIAFVNRASDTDRRGFFKKAFAAAVASSAAGAMVVSPRFAMAAQGDPAILNLPEHSKGLGQPVATMPYGMPSQYEKNLQRRESPGLTRVGGSSVSFCPLQGLFGIITPSGLHFERHHQGWWDIDPTQHRLMINGLVKRQMVMTA